MQDHIGKYKIAIALAVMAYGLGCGEQEERARFQSKDQSPSEAIDQEDLDTETMLTLQVEKLPTECVRLYGKTNLPTNTRLMLNVYRIDEEGFVGQSECTVGTNGRYESVAFGPETGLEDGIYEASVLMPAPSVQPEEVQSVIGAEGEHLSGSLV